MAVSPKDLKNSTNIEIECKIHISTRKKWEVQRLTNKIFNCTWNFTKEEILFKLV